VTAEVSLLFHSTGISLRKRRQSHRFFRVQ
jgi:hypothetical protein